MGFSFRCLDGIKTRGKIMEIRLFIITIVFSIFGLQSNYSSAQTVHVKGIGTESYERYLDMRRTLNKPRDDILVSWVWGYVAGFNIESGYPTADQSPDYESTLAYFDKYCTENPLNNLIQATNNLIHELGGKPKLNR